MSKWLSVLFFEVYQHLGIAPKEKFDWVVKYMEVATPNEAHDAIHKFMPQVAFVCKHRKGLEEKISSSEEKPGNFDAWRYGVFNPADAVNVFRSFKYHKCGPNKKLARAIEQICKSTQIGNSEQRVAFVPVTSTATAEFGLAAALSFTFSFFSCADFKKRFEPILAYLQIHFVKDIQDICTYKIERALRQLADEVHSIETISFLRAEPYHSCFLFFEAPLSVCWLLLHCLETRTDIAGYDLVSGVSKVSIVRNGRANFPFADATESVSAVLRDCYFSLASHC